MKVSDIDGVSLYVVYCTHERTHDVQIWCSIVVFNRSMPRLIWYGLDPKSTCMERLVAADVSAAQLPRYSFQFLHVT